MRLPRTWRPAIVAAAIGLLAVGPGAGSALAARGGLSVTPGILEEVARPGGIGGGVEIANTTNGPLRVGIALRPWQQSRDGAVTPNRRTTLGKVRPNRGSFRLAAGASRTVRLSLVRQPARGSLYGAIEVTGTPLRRGGDNVRVAYRLVSSLRLFPPVGARRYSARAVRLFEHGTVRRGALFLAVKNAGNTIDPIGGRVRISGGGRTLSGVIAPETILPGATVNLRLTRLRGALPRGRYRVGVRLTQGGRRAGGLSRVIRLR
jgi:hypothetical protein